MNFTCPHCQAGLYVQPSQAGSVIVCPHCGGPLQIPWQASPTPYPSSYGGYSAPSEVQTFASKKVAAGICGIMLGGLGVHKFILGFNGAGAIMLSLSLIGIITGMCLILPIFLASAMSIIGLIEGILYLTKSDQDFYHTYAIQRKEWF